jgi:Ca-activated chloride channel family protein
VGLDAQHGALVTDARRGRAGLRRASFAVAALAGWAMSGWAMSGPAAAQDGACRLALVIALDVSSSVDMAEHRLQADGLAAALRSPVVVQALLAPNAGGAVAIAVYEWSGRNQQVLLADWMMMTSNEVIDTLARRVESAPRSHSDFPTALGYALGYGAIQLARAPDCAKHTIDVAGDGTNNEGFEPRNAYAAFDFSGVTVNALVVGGDRVSLLRYFETEVLRGPDAFTEIAESYADFDRAMTRKLLREVRPPMVIGDTR